MSEQDDLVTKIDNLAKHIGETVHTKLSEADASELYAAKSSLKSLAYKDKVETADISDSVLENLKGPQGPQGFGYYGGYVYKNLTLNEWKELGVLGSTHTYEVGDTSNIRIGDFGLVVGAVIDLSTTQALINFKVTGITSNSISTISLGFIVGEPGNMDNVDFSTLVTKEEHALDLDTLRQATIDAAASAAESYAYGDSSDVTTIEEYIEQLSSELKKLVGVQPVGKVWIDFHVPRGGIPFLAQEVSRSLYADLLKYAQDTGQIKTEAEWQEIYAAQDGYVPYYSDGDGVNTFRMPSMGSTYPQFASSLDDVRVFVEEGLPNITGKDTLGWSGMSHGILTNGSINTEGAFRGDKHWASGWIAGNATTQGITENVPYGVGFDASKSNAIYGNSVHVTPKTGKILIGVYAIGTVTNIGSADVTDILADFDANVVHKTGNETIDGLKTHTGNLYAKKASPMVVLQNTGVTKGTNPSSNQTATILVSDSTGTNSAASLLRIMSYYTTAGDNVCRLAVYQPAAGTAWKGLDLTYKANGTTAMSWAGENVALFNSSNQLKFPNGNLLWIA